MKFLVERRTLVVIPETPADVAYIEDTLGLRRDGDRIRLVRKNAFNLGSMGRLETAREPLHPSPLSPAEQEPLEEAGDGEG